METRFISLKDCVGKTFVSRLSGKKASVKSLFSRWEHNVAPNDGHDYVDYFRINAEGKEEVRESYGFLMEYNLVEA